jgi:hypothetical protein
VLLSASHRRPIRSPQDSRMTSQNDELSSHRTRTNRRPAEATVTTGSTAVLDAPATEQPQEA